MYHNYLLKRGNLTHTRAMNVIKIYTLPLFACLIPNLCKKAASFCRLIFKFVTKNAVQNAKNTTKIRKWGGVFYSSWFISYESWVMPHEENNTFAREAIVHNRAESGKADVAKGRSRVVRNKPRVNPLPTRL